MSDVEEVGEGCGSSSNKGRRLTLTLGDKLRVPALAKTAAGAGGKPFMTVEVRSKKRVSGGLFSRSGHVGGVTDAQSEDDKLTGGLTAKEQLSRINAISTADSLSAKEESARKAREVKGTELPVGDTQEELDDSGDLATDVPNAVDDSFGDQGDCNAEAQIVAPASIPSSDKSGYDEKGKRYSHGTNRHKDKEGGVKKLASSRVSSKHIKLDIENALSGAEDRYVLRSSSKRRGTSARGNMRRVSREVAVYDGMDVRELSLAMAEKSDDVLRGLSHMGVEAKLNTKIEQEVAYRVAAKFGHRPKLMASMAQKEKELSEVDYTSCEIMPRSPVVTVMGHVDHGKTSLLDALRKSDVAGKEFRGITQHIGAYQIEVDGKKITFLDTPGHEAFADMRARGANVTDIVVLVIAADDGIMPQTVESINHVKAAGVSLIVAVNKIDKEDADITKAVNGLLQYGIVPEELGGDVMVVPVSARTGENLDKLKASILLLAEILELSAPVDCRAQGVVIESKIDRGCGVVATVIVQKGTLKKGNIVVAGDSSYGKVRNMFDDAGCAVESALPSTPVKILGLNSVPKAGDTFLVMLSEAQARDLLEHKAGARLHEEREATDATPVSILPDLSKKVEEINIILKADVVGSLDAIFYSVSQVEHEEVKFNILHKDVGDVTKSDVLLAEASSAMILAFNVKVDAQARDLVRQKDVDIRHYRVIYDLIDDVKNMIGGKLKPVLQEVQVGLLVVRQVFSQNKGGVVIGCYVAEGLVSNGASVRITRGEDVIHEGKIKALRRFKDDVKEVNHGLECGVLIESVKDIAVGDTIRVLEIVEHARVLG